MLTSDIFHQKRLLVSPLGCCFLLVITVFTHDSVQNNAFILIVLHSSMNQPQAMFKVLNRSPPIPEKLSSEGKDFLQRCFQRNPAQRPSAKELLQHPFLRNSRDQNGSSFRPPCELKWMVSYSFFLWSKHPLLHLIV